MVQNLQNLQQHTGWSCRRLTRAIGLPRSSVLRWTTRLRRGEVAVQPSRRKTGPADPAVLDAAMAALHHGAHRSRGAPALWHLWRDGLSRRDFERRIRDHRLSLQREQRASLCRIGWPQPGAVWAMDPAQYGRLQWNLVGDLASRFRFDLLVAPDMPASRIGMQLRTLFDHFGAPLVLKRDNGSNLMHVLIDGLLDEYGVLALTSPPYYPRYNGAIEYAQREIKTTIDVLTLAGMPLPTALAEGPALLNIQPRPCLGGQSASQSFFGAPHAFQHDFTLNRRKEVKGLIQDQARTIVEHMPKDSQRAHDAAWRQAIERWMLDNDLMKVVHPAKVSPTFI